MIEQNTFPNLPPGKNRSHRVRVWAKVEDHDGQPALMVPITIADLLLARRGTGQHKNVGFILDVEFQHPNGGTYALHSAWVSLNNR